MRARDNPFRTEQTDALEYRASGFEWTELLARLQGQSGRGAVRGAEGAGKSTLLRDLGEKLAVEGFEVRSLRPSLDDPRLARAQIRELPREAGPRTAILLDGADRVGHLEWRRLLRVARPAGVLVITTHRQGRLRTLHRCRTSVALLEELASELVQGTELSTVSFEDVFRRQKGNVRTSLRALYDRFSES